MIKKNSKEDVSVLHSRKDDPTKAMTVHKRDDQIKSQISYRKEDISKSSHRKDNHSKHNHKKDDHSKHSYKMDDQSKSSYRKDDHSRSSPKKVVEDKNSSTIVNEPICKIIPNKFYFKKLKKEKHVKFDKYLMLLEERNDFMTAVEDNSFELTPIPNFIAFLVLAIRAQFEVELKKGICFLEAKYFPSNSDVVALAEAVYLNCDTYNNVLEVLSKANCTFMFVTLLELLQRMEERIIQVSSEIMNYVRENSIFSYLRPHDFIIIDQINNFSAKCFMTYGPTRKENKKEGPSMNMINGIITEYYFDESKTRIENIVDRNKLHELLYSEIREIKCTSRRYLCRFILRNCIYLIRRYVSVTGSILRVQRNESPKETNVTSIPYISEFAIYRMAQFLAVSSTEIKDTRDDVNDRIHFLMNVFSIHMENLWFRQNKISNVVVSTEEEKCHQDCPCII